MKSITVPTVNGPRRVRVIAKRGVWAVTPRLTAPGLAGTVRGRASVTHVPTGLCIQHPDMTTVDARKLMRALPLDTLASASFDRKRRASPGPLGTEEDNAPAKRVVVAFFRERGWW